jgi:hypothetical protein
VLLRGAAPGVPVRKVTQLAFAGHDPFAIGGPYTLLDQGKTSQFDRTRLNTDD